MRENGTNATSYLMFIMRIQLNIMSINVAHFVEDWIHSYPGTVPCNRQSYVG